MPRIIEQKGGKYPAENVNSHKGPSRTVPSSPYVDIGEIVLSPQNAKKQWQGAKPETRGNMRFHAASRGIV